MFKRGWIIFALVAWFPVNAAESVRESNRILNDRFTFYLGGFFPQVSSAIRLDADIAGGIGDTISLEDVLGLEDSKSVLWGGFNWRMARRHTLELEAFQLNRSGSVGAVTDPFQIGNSILQVGARVDTVFDLGIGRVTYGYSFIRDEKKEAVVEAGVHWASVDVAMRLSGAITDVETMMPIAGGAELLVDSGIDIAYSPWKHFGFGGGVRYFNLRLEADKERLDGEFDFDYWGPTLFIVARF